MSVAHTIQHLQMLHRTIPGISVPEKYPGSLNTAQLPAVIIWPGRGIERPVTARAVMVRVERRYDCRFFLEPLGQNNYDTPVQNAIELLDLCKSTYWENKKLAEGYIELLQIEDSGIISGGELVAIAPLTYAGTAYKGFVCTLTILELLKP